MSERDGHPAGVPCWVEAITPDPARVLPFYAGLFGWEPEDAGDGHHVCSVRGRAVAGIAGDPGGPSAAWRTHVCVDSADAAAERAEAAGGKVVLAAGESPLGGREALLADRSGAPFAVWEAGGGRGARLVNEPSAWAMSFLLTDDRAGALEFYGELFGWHGEPFGPGGEIVLFRLPGYGGGEPEQPVPRDVIGGIAPQGGERLPPSWVPDFRVRDADAAAASAPELGGTVLVGPYDVPGFRQLVLADPAGAPFTASAPSCRDADGGQGS